MHQPTRALRRALRRATAVAVGAALAVAGSAASTSPAVDPADAAARPPAPASAATDPAPDPATATATVDPPRAPGGSPRDAATASGAAATARPAGVARPSGTAEASGTGAARTPTASRPLPAPGPAPVVPPSPAPSPGPVVGGDSPAVDPSQQPAAAAVVAADGFGRSVARGWGTAEVGGRWSVLGSPSAFSVAGGVGRMTIPRAGAGLGALLGDVRSDATDLTVRVATPRLADGGGAFVSLVGRRVGADDYRAKVKIAPSGAVTLYLNRLAGGERTLGAITVPGVSYAPGDALRIRLTVTGTSPTTLQAKVWEDGRAEPAGWQLTATDATPGLQVAGGAGVVSYLSASSTSAPLVVVVDDLRATTLEAPLPEENRPPAPGFTSTVGGLTATFDASTTTDVDGTVALYGWDFGDGALGTGVAPSHTYRTAGTYSVTLTATDDDGDAASVTRAVTVGGPPPVDEPPVARLVVTVDGLAVTLDGSSSTDADGSVTGYAWELGDGATASGATATHTYAAVGEYTIMLVVTDDDGLQASASEVVVLTGGPAPAGEVARDDFARDVAEGWGPATTGGAWALTGPASAFSVAGGEGRMTLARPGAGAGAYLGAVSAGTDAQVRFAATPVADGGGTFVSLVGRRVESGDYRGKVRVAADGTATVYLTRTDAGTETTLAVSGVDGLRLSEGGAARMRLQVTGTAPTTLRVRAWADGVPEPAVWQLTATDATPALQQAGGLGLVGYVSGSASTTPVVLSFDELVASGSTAP